MARGHRGQAVGVDQGDGLAGRGNPDFGPGGTPPGGLSRHAWPGSRSGCNSRSGVLGSCRGGCGLTQATTPGRRPGTRPCSSGRGLGTDDGHPDRSTNLQDRERYSLALDLAKMGAEALRVGTMPGPVCGTIGDQFNPRPSAIRPRPESKALRRWSRIGVAEAGGRSRRRSRWRPSPSSCPPPGPAATTRDPPAPPPPAASTCWPGPGRSRGTRPRRPRADARAPRARRARRRRPSRPRPPRGRPGSTPTPARPPGPRSTSHGPSPARPGDRRRAPVHPAPRSSTRPRA